MVQGSRKCEKTGQAKNPYPKRPTAVTQKHAAKNNCDDDKFEAFCTNFTRMTSMNIIHQGNRSIKEPPRLLSALRLRLTSRAKGSLRIRRSVVFWNRRISCSALCPGRYLLFAGARARRFRLATAGTKRPLPGLGFVRAMYVLQEVLWDLTVFMTDNHASASMPRRPSNEES